ncbi:hypothetical protein V8E53_014417, partial [Lactarius tabidus]
MFLNSHCDVAAMDITIFEALQHHSKVPLCHVALSLHSFLDPPSFLLLWHLFSTTFPVPTPPSTPLILILTQDPDTKTEVEPAYDSSATAIVDAMFLDIFEASFTPLIPMPTQDIFEPSSPLLTPTLAQDPASDTKMRVEQEPLAHLSFANTMADATANVLDLDGTFGHRVPVSPSITDST